MSFENKYDKRYMYFELLCKSFVLIAIDFDFLIFFIDPQMYIDFFSIFPLLFNTFFAVFMIYNIALTAKPKIIIKDDYLYVYSINNLNVKRKYQIENISSVFVNKDKKNKKYDSDAIVINMFIDDKKIKFALNEYDYEIFRGLIKEWNIQSGNKNTGDNSLS